MTTIYALYKDYTPFYVGKTKSPNNRLNAHKRRFGKDITMRTLDTTGDHVSQWKPVEKAWISFYKVWNEAILINENDGGGGRKAKYTDEELAERQKLYYQKRIENGKMASYVRKWLKDNPAKRRQYEATANSKAYRNKWWRENVKVNTRQRKQWDT